MRFTSPRPIATALVLVGAMTMLAGCGDDGAHLPAGMSGSSAAYTGGATGIDAVDSVLGGDPGPIATGSTSTSLEDPVLAGYDGVDSISTAGLDDPYSQAVSDLDDYSQADLGAMESDPYGDDLMPANYGRGYDDGFGYGDGIFSAALTGSWGGTGLMDAGLMDAGVMDAGFEDPDLMDGGEFDAGLSDPGLMDAGFSDPGFVDPGFDAGAMDVGMDAGFDPGFAAGGFDPGFADVGAVDVGGFDPGFADVGAVDVGGFDVGGFDAGIGF